MINVHSCDRWVHKWNRYVFKRLFDRSNDPARYDVSPRHNRLRAIYRMIRLIQFVRDNGMPSSCRIGTCHHSSLMTIKNPTEND